MLLENLDIDYLFQCLSYLPLKLKLNHKYYAKLCISHLTHTYSYLPILTCIYPYLLVFTCSYPYLQKFLILSIKMLNC